MAESRRCQVKDYHETKQGNFIQFGIGVYHDEGNNPHQKTIAIVELDGGQVIEVDPGMIKFID